MAGGDVRRGFVRFLVCFAGPVVSVAAAAMQWAEGVQNLRGTSLLEGLAPLEEDWRYGANAGASLLAFLLSLGLLGGLMAYEIGRDRGRRVCLWACGAYLALTLAVNVTWAATVRDGGAFLFLLVLTVPYPALVLLLLRRPLEPDPALSSATRLRQILPRYAAFGFLGGVVPLVAVPNLLAAKMAPGEVGVISTLRSIASAQAQFQTTAKVDLDGDGAGEFGTFLELTGAAGLRTSPDGSAMGPSLSPPCVSAALAGVGPDGIVTKSGYCFRIYLPDTRQPVAGWTHEKGPAASPGFAGGAGKVNTDLAETIWCAYAWPLKARRGQSWIDVYFVNQSADILRCRNEKARWYGIDHPPPPGAAFRGAGITSPLAIGTAGPDGVVWGLSN